MPPEPASSWDWPGFLESLARMGVRQSLEPMGDLLAHLGQPQQGIPVIHVAGTNGKGSVCALLSHILAACGYRVGRYISPHLISWRERIWVSGEWISEADWSRILADLRAELADYPQPWPTQFDVTTAAAWLYFRQQQVDCVVLEVGLGGRLDSTNAGIEPAVTAITSIGRDHWQRLGDTLEQIAAEKAGICKPNVPLIVAPQPPEVMVVLSQRAEALGSPFQVAEPAVWGASQGEVIWRDQPYPLPLRGEVQLTNVAVALATLEELRRQGWRIPLVATQQGLAQTRWPGRLQTVALAGQTLLFDGAHNEPGAQALRHFVDSHCPGSITWFVGLLKDKDGPAILQALLRPQDCLYALPIASHAALASDELAALAQRIQPQLATCQALADLPEWQALLAQLPPASPNLVLCGSLYLIGQIMQDCLGWELAQ